MTPALTFIKLQMLWGFRIYISLYKNIERSVRNPTFKLDSLNFMKYVSLALCRACIVLDVFKLKFCMFYVFIYGLRREPDIPEPFLWRFSLTAAGSVQKRYHLVKKKLDVIVVISRNNKAGPFHALISLIDEYFDIVSGQILITNCWPDIWVRDNKRSHRTLTIFLQFWL